MDWRCSCSCSKLIPSVTEESVIFVQELSAPRWASTDDAFFQTELGWSVLRVVGLDQDFWRVELEDAGSFGSWLDRCSVDLRALIVAHLCKNKGEGGSARASPVAAPMLKSVSF